MDIWVLLQTFWHTSLWWTHVPISAECMHQSGIAGSQGMHMCYVSKYTAKSFIFKSDYTNFHSSHQENEHVSSSCFILPKHTLNATTSSQGRTGNPQGQQRKTRNKLKPPIKWNLNRKPVLVWGQSQYRLLWDAVGMGEGLDLGPTKQRSWTRVPLSKESPPDCKRSQLRLCFSLPLLRLKGSAL